MTAPHPCPPAHAPGAQLEPAIAAVLARTLRKRAQGPYRALREQDVRDKLERLCGARSGHAVHVDDVQRLAGGASKEMFSFTLRHDANATPERLVLRLDPLESIIETSRQREAEAIAALRGTVPVPAVRFVDQEGEFLGQSGLITSFVPGVTRPSTQTDGGVSGIGTDYGAAAAHIAPRFLDNLVAIHAFDWQHAHLPSFSAPRAGSREAALWQVEWYERIWLQDALEQIPLASLVRRWLRSHAPVCAAPVFVHGDYRMGNFLFDEQSLAMTAVLDWELAHIGDFHEDVGYVTQKLFGLVDADKRFLCCGLFTREEFLHRYETLSGRTIDPDTLHYYEVLNAWKSVVHTFATCLTVAAAGNNHQDALLSWLAPVGHLILADIASKLRGRY
ncbi:MAG: phosphotransferase family protein [Proteobacteria bacterium]|nr:phosphotransferase family protein [Pseudomonadota bacterium]